MKKLSLFFLLLFTIVLAFSSCKDDETCYECLGFDNGVIRLDDLGLICVGDQGVLGSTITEETILQGVEEYEASGGTCTRQ